MQQWLRLSVAIGVSFLCGASVGTYSLRYWQKVKAAAAISETLPRRVHRREMMMLPSAVPTRVIMLGDSIIEEGDWTEITGCWPIRNFGISGDSTTNVLQRLDDVISLEPRAVALMIGTNDLSNNTDIATITQNIRSIVERLLAARIVPILHTVPMRTQRDVTKLNDAITNLAGRLRVTLVSIPITADDLRDGLHFRASGYAKWQSALAPAIAPYCGAKPFNP